MTIAKAGIPTVLNSRTSVIEAVKLFVFLLLCDVCFLRAHEDFSQKVDCGHSTIALMRCFPNLKSIEPVSTFHYCNAYVKVRRKVEPCICLLLNFTHVDRPQIFSLDVIYDRHQKLGLMTYVHEFHLFSPRLALHHLRIYSLFQCIHFDVPIPLPPPPQSKTKFPSSPSPNYSLLQFLLPQPSTLLYPIGIIWIVYLFCCLLDML